MLPDLSTTARLDVRPAASKIMNLGEHSDMNPNQPFRAENQPQFQSQYSYPQSTSAYAMDQEMHMGADSFAATVQAHADNSLNDEAGGSGSIQGATNMSASTTGMSAPGMAPPQNSGHPYSPSGARQSIDETQDGGLSGGDPKRKRSKVSRACDECRRKKVRCDAAADDGTIKTCSNCTRAGLTCEYSRIPMKRGPSKGYIKELSERVQQVESLQLALSNTPGYRPSLDTNSGVYAEQPYSPDDPLSLKRNFSFSAEQRSPFVGPEYHRDRMPSVGGWNSGSPHSAIFRARDRGSIALAPDQQPTNPVSFSKPFWSQDSEESPPAKRQKMDIEIVKPEIGSDVLKDYYRQLHTNLPVLPDADTAVAIINKTSPKVQYAFVTVVQQLSSPEPKAPDNAIDNKGSEHHTSTVFATYSELEEYMWNVARESPESRSSEDNLIYLWSYILMAIKAETDLTKLHDGTLPKTILIKQAVDLGWSCVTAASQNSAVGSDQNNKNVYLDEFGRAWHCAAVLARLHALAVGSGSPIPRWSHQYYQKRVPHVPDVLTPTGVIVALSASQLTVVSSVVQDNLPPNQWGRNMDMHHRMTIQEQFEELIASRASAAGCEPLVEQLRLFIDLTLSRYTVNFHPMHIIIPAAALAEALRKGLSASEPNPVYNPFDLHFFTLTTITLLEFLSESPESEMFKIATKGIEDIKGALEQISEKAHAGEPLEDNHVEGSAPVRKAVHWADVLLKMTNERVKNVTTANANGASNSTSGGSRLGDGSYAAVDFSLLLRHGYLTVLAQQVPQ